MKFTRTVRFHYFGMFLFLGAAVFPCVRDGHSAPADVVAQARSLVDTAGIRGGLIVHVGGGDGELTAALRIDDKYVVHGLPLDGGDIQRSRAYVRESGLAGRVTFSRLTGEGLPFIDNVVNLIVFSDPAGISAEEAARVLTPGGVSLIKRNGNWNRRVKPWPKKIDDWTHFLHDADGNPVASDMVVGPPFHMQWVASPIHSRTHHHLTSVNVMVSSAGRLFCIVDEGPTALPDSLPNRWALVARDAFNGVTLWRRPLPVWQASAVHSRNLFPVDLYRRLVADGQMVYATLGIFGPVTALDAATGETIRTYAGTENTAEIICSDGVLYLVIHLSGKDELDRRRMAFRRTEVQPKRIVAIRAATGELLWQKSDAVTAEILPMSLAVKNGKVYFQNTDGIVALEAGSGAEMWRASSPSAYERPTWSAPTLVALDDVVLSADRGMRKPGPKVKKIRAGNAVAAEFTAFSAETGRRLWQMPCDEGDQSPVDIFAVGESLWVGDGLKRNDPAYNLVRDPLTGKILAEYPPYDGWVDWHHHRCYRDKATERYILAGRTGVEFIDLKTGELTPHNWLRGNCKYGVLPCNGLLYMPPDQCGCYVESKLTGFHALAPRRTTEGEFPTTGNRRLERGPAFKQITGAASSKTDSPGRNRVSRIRGSSDWPTYRGDQARSGSTSAQTPPRLEQAWEKKLGGRLTPPVVARGRLYAASVDEHRLYVLDADTGEPLWTYAAGGRIDSPPTVSQGIAVFGCRDGWVYALRASDGELIWRLRAAPEDARLMDRNHIESVWPVHGSVLVQDGAVHFAAGRSSYLDGGVWMYKVDLISGKVLLQKRFYSRDPETGRTIFLFNPYEPDVRQYQSREMPGVMPDIMSAANDAFWMRGVTFDSDLEIREDDLPHLFSWMGFLDDTWWERAYWIYGDHCYSSCHGIYHAQTILPTGRLLVFDDTSVYGYQDETFKRKTKGVGIFATGKTPTVREKKARRKRDRNMVVCDWRTEATLYPRGIVLAGNTIFLAGPPRFNEAATREFLDQATTDDQNPPQRIQDALDTFEGRQGGMICAVNKSTGKIIAEYKIDSVPVFDGLIAADTSLYISTASGAVVRMRANE